MRRRVKLVLLTRSLEIGGAERQLVALARGLDRKVFDVTVLCLYGGGVLRNDLVDAGIELISLEKRSRWDLFRFGPRLLSILRKLQPDILYSYMTIQNLLAVLLKPALPTTRIVWGVRSSNLNDGQFDWFARSSERLQASLSRFANLIIFNSWKGRDDYLSGGLSKSQSVVIPNGIDTTRFAPDREKGLQLRAAWGIPAASFLIGIVARLDPMKGHQTFLEAASIFSRTSPEARFVVVGDGPVDYGRALHSLADRLGLTDKIVWTGFLNDMRSAYNALDICCSSSAYGEGTSNSIAEAMACGVPCVATDVGDSRLIVGNTGIVVPPRNPEALAAGWADAARRMIEDPRLGFAARERVESQLGLSSLISRTSAALLEIART